MRKIVILFLFGLILATTVYADIFEVHIEEINARVFRNETATYKVIFSNNANVPLSFRVYSPDVEWNIKTDPLDEYLFQVYPGEKKEAIVSVKPTESITLPGPYSVPLNIRNEETKRLEERTLNFYLRSEDAPKQYVATILANIESEQLLDPRKPFSLKILLENKNKKKIEGLSIVARSELDNVNLDEKISLGSLEKKNFEYEFELNSKQKPGTYKIDFNFVYANETLTKEEQLVEILPIIPTFEKETYIEDGFLINKITGEYKNTGNIASTQKVFIPLGKVESWFSSADQEAKLVSGKEIGYEWELTLESNETKNVSIKVSYAPIIYVLLLLTLCVVFLFVLKRPVTVSKSVENVHIKDNAVIGFTVIVKLKNVANSPIRDIEVKESVPDLVIVDEHFQSILKPEKIVRTDAETIMKWKVEDLEPKEERIIRYTVKSKFPIVGQLLLDRTQATYRIETKEKMSFSDKVSLGPKKE